MKRQLPRARTSMVAVRWPSCTSTGSSLASAAFGLERAATPRASTGDQRARRDRHVRARQRQDVARAARDHARRQLGVRRILQRQIDVADDRLRRRRRRRLGRRQRRPAAAQARRPLDAPAQRARADASSERPRARAAGARARSDRGSTARTPLGDALAMRAHQRPATTADWPRACGSSRSSSIADHRSSPTPATRSPTKRATASSRRQRAAARAAITPATPRPPPREQQRERPPAGAGQQRRAARAAR